MLVIASMIAVLRIVTAVIHPWDGSQWPAIDGSLALVLIVGLAIGVSRLRKRHHASPHK